MASKPRQKAPVKTPFLCAYCGSEVRYIGELHVGERKYPDGSLVRDDPEVRKDESLWTCDYCNKRRKEGKPAYGPYKHTKILEQLDSIRKQIQTPGAKKKALLLLKELATYFSALEASSEKERDERLSWILQSGDATDLIDAKLTDTERVRVYLYRDNPLLSEDELAAESGVDVGTWKSQMFNIRQKLGNGCTKDLVLKRKTLNEEELQKALAEFKRSPRS
jgi:hypothetical protein